MKYFSMFAGIGGFDLALNRLGHECVGYSEIDKWAIQTYGKNFGGVKNYGDATKIKAGGLPDFDLLCAGFPCQAFSVAGKRRGFKDTRGTLFFEIARVLRAKRPKHFLLENVKGLLNHEGGKTYAIIIQTLAELGYGVEWVVLNSKFFGVPQNRERVFLVGSLGGEPGSQILPFRKNAKKVQRLFEPKVYTQDRHDLRTHKTEGEVPTLKERMGTGGSNVPMVARCLDKNMGKGITPERFFEGKQRNVVRAFLTPSRKKKRQNGRRQKEPDEPMFTLTGQDIHGVNDGRLRRLTPVECERLQGFPDGWTDGVSDTQRYRQLGNAVTVNVVYELARAFQASTTISSART